MSRLIKYSYQGEEKQITFSFQHFRTPYEAVAAAENIDISKFLETERQLEMISDTKTVKNHRESHFNKLGFGKIYLLKNNPKDLNNI